MYKINSPSEATFDERSLQLVTIPDRLEISAVNTLPITQSIRETNSTCPVRDSAQKARKRFAKRADILFGDPEDVMNCENN